ncbi:AraC family transcriptional regulator [Sphingomonas sp.]|uniref:AraC family transcriptional regulator n=1 Tax=Sphingomonas sp. TaxID=28214 RepID=UPI002DD66D0A|nr:helix-turn-helix transcriptional regulator [Sphingomonas sp.]
MPLLNERSEPLEWTEPDDVPRAIVTYGMKSEMIVDFELQPHRHLKGQILLVQRGALACEIEGGLWIVPPRSAIWIPGGALHSIKVTGALEGYGAFISDQVDSRLPAACRTIAATPLLRELLVRAAGLPLLYEEAGANARLLAVLLDELVMAPVEGLHLPMPADARLRQVTGEMIAAPAERGTVASWAARAGMSERTLLRSIRRETGMSFGRWRQQLGIVLAVQWMAGGTTIQQAATDLGYESVPAFMTMFKKALGISPGRYMAERHATKNQGGS